MHVCMYARMHVCLFNLSVLTKELYITLNISTKCVFVTNKFNFWKCFSKLLLKWGGGHWEVISAHYLLPIHIQSRLKVKIDQAVIGSNMDHYHFSNLCKVISGHICPNSH